MANNYNVTNSRFENGYLYLFDGTYLMVDGNCAT